MENKRAKALSMARRIHRGDRWGSHAYRHHLELVEAEARNHLQANPALEKVLQKERLECLALLHDAIEDHPEAKPLVKEVFPELVEDLEALAKKAKEPYKKYIERLVATGSLYAIAVKRADLTVNLENNPPGRLEARYSYWLPIVTAALTDC